MNPPRWAQDLLLDAALHVGYEGPFTLVWRRKHKRLTSTGRTYLTSRRIAVTAGSNRFGQKLALLHEAAHAFTGDMHTARYWDMAWRLYRWAKMPIRKTLLSESSYMKGALVAYRRSMKEVE